MEDLLEIMGKLRNPDGGCPWDLEQTFASIAPYTIEEAYEVDEAIRDNDMASLRDELGDLLFQTVFHAQMAREKEAFTFDDVVQSISDKMVRRHPHVFADASERDADTQVKAWEEQKAEERAKKAAQSNRAVSALDGVSMALPALMRAVKLQNRAARVGFDWPSVMPVIDKIQEEAGELAEAYETSVSNTAIREEYGDLLFVIANLGRHINADPEECLRAANAKFTKRFHGVEAKLAKLGKTPADSDLQEMDALWDTVKREE